MEQNSYEIPIYIKPVQNGGGELNGGEPMLPQQNQNKNSSQSNNNLATKGAKSNANVAKAFASQLVGKAAQTAVNNYGNLTGDYVTQQNIQATISETTAIVSAVAMGPLGIAMYAVNKGFEIFNYYAQLKRSEVESAFKQKRVYAEQTKA